MKDIVVCTREHHRTHDERLNADGATPPEQPPSFDLWPLQVKVSPARKPGADYVGLLWVSARDGRPGGEVYRIMQKHATATYCSMAMSLPIDGEAVDRLTARRICTRPFPATSRIDHQIRNRIDDRAPWRRDGCSVCRPSGRWWCVCRP